MGHGRGRGTGRGTTFGLVFALAGAAAAGEAVLIGGGDAPDRSPARFERDLRWSGDVLREQGLPVTTFFADGDAAGPDVYDALPATTPTGAYEPLARVFGDLERERRRYRGHELPDVADGTRRGALEPALDALFERTANAPLLLVYGGHGRRSPDDSPAGVALDLWDATAIDARALHALLGARRSGTREPFRFVFGQCHSGGFHRLAYADPDTGLALADPVRCGFTAASAHASAGECDAGPDSGEHLDYVTHFFAALADRERDGSVLDRDPDLDADGRVTLREAHLHALGETRGTDLGRSTSEDWLDAWQPWYLRWLPQPPTPPNNEYARLFRTLAQASGVPLQDGLGRVLRARLDEHEARVETLREARRSVRAEAGTLRRALREAAAKRWPALLGPYTGGYAGLVASGELARVTDWLEGAPDYPLLVERQGRDAELGEEILEAGRDAARMRELLHLRRLAVLKGQLETYGDAADRVRYAALLDCEEETLVIDAPTFATTD